MGGKPSKAVARTVTNKIKNYNVENRAQKAIEDHKHKPKVAPYYASTEEDILRTIEETPEIKEELEKKDILTIDRMQKLQIETSGTKPDLVRRELPQKRTREDTFAMMEEPDFIPKGRLSLLHMAEIFDKYKIDPKMETIKKIAYDYNLDLLSAGLLVKYFEKIDYGDETVTGDESGKKLKDKFVQLVRPKKDTENDDSSDIIKPIDPTKS